MSALPSTTTPRVERIGQVPSGPLGHLGQPVVGRIRRLGLIEGGQRHLPPRHGSTHRRAAVAPSRSHRPAPGSSPARRDRPPSVGGGGPGSCSRPACGSRRRPTLPRRGLSSRSAARVNAGAFMMSHTGNSVVCRDEGMGVVVPLPRRTWPPVGRMQGMREGRPSTTKADVLEPAPQLALLVDPHVPPSTSWYASERAQLTFSRTTVAPSRPAPHPGGTRKSSSIAVRSSGMCSRISAAMIRSNSPSSKGSAKASPSTVAALDPVGTWPRQPSPRT